MENLGYSNQEVAGMYRVALTANDHSPAFDLLRLIIHGGMMRRSEYDTSKADSIPMSWHDRCEYVLTEKIPESTKEYVKKIAGMLSEEKAEEIRDIR